MVEVKGFPLNPETVKLFAGGSTATKHRNPFWLGCLKQIEGDSWFTRWLNHLPEPSIFQKGHLCLGILFWSEINGTDLEWFDYPCSRAIYFHQGTNACHLRNGFAFASNMFPIALAAQDDVPMGPRKRFLGRYGVVGCKGGSKNTRQTFQGKP